MERSGGGQAHALGHVTIKGLEKEESARETKEIASVS